MDKRILLYCKECKTIYAANPKGCPWCVIAKLKEFACEVIRKECWGIKPMDGYEIQDFAERLGLIAEHIATEADVDEEDDYEIGDKIYKFTKVLESEVKNG